LEEKSKIISLDRERKKKKEAEIFREKELTNSFYNQNSVIINEEIRKMRQKIGLNERGSK